MFVPTEWQAAWLQADGDELCYVRCRLEGLATIDLA